MSIQLCYWYFAYGANMDAQGLARRVGRNVLEGKRACLEGYRLVFNQRGGYASVVPHPSDKVWGVLYRLTETELSRLDQYEGVPECYGRQKVWVTTENGERVRAYVYIGKENLENVWPKQTYLSELLRGARQHQLPQEYIQFLEGVAALREQQVKGGSTRTAPKKEQTP